MVGEKYGYLTITEELERRLCPNGKRKRIARCLCQCGKEKDILYTSIKTGHTKSCGCLHKKVQRNRLKTHGMSNSRLFSILKGIKHRCNNPNHKGYKRYGARGINCEWVSFEDFYKDMGSTYQEGLTIDRKDNDRNYCKSNCRWVTMKVQAKNRRHKTAIYWNGETKSKTQWAKHFGLSYHAFKQRINRAGGFQEMILKYNM